jgi:type 2A phosphatase activator TIP41
LTPLTDATFIANTLSSFTPQEKQAGAGTGWRGIGRKVEVAILQEVDADALPALQSLTLS